MQDVRQGSTVSIKDILKEYRRNVGVVLFNRAGQVWLGRRVGGFTDLGPEFGQGPDQWRWQMPQGGVDEGEDIETAAKRELQEETGVRSATLIAMTPGWLAYDFPRGYKKKNWKGQRQKWAAMLFDGKDSEIDLEADDHQEFDDWRWAELEEVTGLIVPFKRVVYAEIVSAYRPLRDFIRSRG